MPFDDGWEPIPQDEGWEPIPSVDPETERSLRAAEAITPAQNPLSEAWTQLSHGHPIEALTAPVDWFTGHELRPLQKVGEAVSKGAETFTRALLTPGSEAEGGAPKVVGELAGGLVPKTPFDVALTVAPAAGARVAGWAEEGLGAANAALRAARAAKDEQATARALTQVDRMVATAQNARNVAGATDAAMLGVAAPALVEGSQSLSQGVSEGDPAKVGQGILQLGMGGLAAHGGVKGLRALNAEGFAAIPGEVAALRRRRTVRLPEEPVAVEDVQAPRPQVAPEEGPPVAAPVVPEAPIAPAPPEARIVPPEAQPAPRPAPESVAQAPEAVLPPPEATGGAVGVPPARSRPPVDAQGEPIRYSTPTPEMATAARELEGELAGPSQRDIWAHQAGAVRLDFRQRVKLDTGETGIVTKYAKDGTMTVDVNGAKRTVQPEGVEFLPPEPLGRPQPSGILERPQIADTGAIRTAPQVPTPEAGPLPPAAQSAVEKLQAAIKRGKIANAQTERLRSPERSARIKAAMEEFQGNPSPEGLAAADRKLWGEMPRWGGEARADLTPEEGQAIWRAIGDAQIKGYDKLHAGRALRALLSDSEPVPNNYALRQLDKVLGPGVVDSLVRARRGKWALASDILNIRRTLMATADVSFLRQAFFLGVGHPVEFVKSIGKAHAYFFSPKQYESFVRGLEADPDLVGALESGLHLDSVNVRRRVKSTTIGGNEMYGSELAENIPGVGIAVRASARSMMGGLDSLRMAVWKDQVARLRRLGQTVEKNPKGFADYANSINFLSGRGKLPRLLAKPGAAEALSQTLFAPRLMASRFQVLNATLNPVWWKNASPGSRREMARSIAGTVGFYVTSMSAAKMMLGDKMKVETDPRSTDFLRIRVGHTRIDPPAGIQPYVRLLAQLAGGPEYLQTKDLETGQKTWSRAWTTGARRTMAGKLIPLDATGQSEESRGTAIGRFARGKLAPWPGTALDLLLRKDMGGQPVTLKGESIEAFLPVPMALRDIYEAFKAEGLIGLPLGALSLYGFGVGTYRTPEEARLRTRGGTRLRLAEQSGRFGQ